MSKPTAIDLFAGAGGLSTGLRRAGFRIAAAVELDECAAKTFSQNHRGTPVLVRDVRKVRASELTKLTGLALGELDLLTGCPPCQGFSTLRTRKRTTSVDDSRNDLIFDFLRLVRTLKPRAVVLENVSGLVRDQRYAEFCSRLTKAGYRYVAKVVNAASFGVPQRRERLVLVAMLGRDVPPDWLTPKEERHTTVRDAIGGLPKAGSSGDPLHDYPENRSEKMLARIRMTPRDGGSRRDLPVDEQCRCHGETNGFNDVYGRMSWANVAPTITSGCTNPSKGRFLHPHEHRAITLREAALLQSFPPNYRFDLSRGKEHAAAQIGNAFPPLLIHPIARKLVESLRK